LTVPVEAGLRKKMRPTRQLGVVPVESLPLPEKNMNTQLSYSIILTTVSLAACYAPETTEDLDGVHTEAMQLPMTGVRYGGATVGGVAKAMAVTEASVGGHATVPMAQVISGKAAYKLIPPSLISPDDDVHAFVLDSLLLPGSIALLQPGNANSATCTGSRLLYIPFRSDVVRPKATEARLGITFVVPPADCPSPTGCNHTLYEGESGSNSKCVCTHTVVPGSCPSTVTNNCSGCSHDGNVKDVLETFYSFDQRFGCTESLDMLQPGASLFDHCL
jgi:hypothetical protein